MVLGGVFRADPNPDYQHLGRVEDLNLGPPFDKNTGMGEPVNIAGEYSTLTKTADGFIWEKRDKTTYTFNANGTL